MSKDKKRCMCAGTIDLINGNDYLKRVYDPHYFSPTIATFCGGNQEIKIIVARERKKKCKIRTKH